MNELSTFLSRPEVSATLVALGLLAAVVTAGHALLTRRDARAAWGWIAVCWLFPFAGPGLYLIFGVNRLRTRARRLVRGHGIASHRSPIGAEHQDDVRRGAPAHPPLPVWLEQVARTADVLTRRPLVGGNQLAELHNGETAYPVMLDAIAQARRTVWLSTYIFDRDEVGKRFVDALAAAHRRGVQVRVLIDGAGERYSLLPIGTLLRRAGVPYARFNPLRLIPPSLHLNLRSHRKLLVVDDELAFTGGMNIGARHLANDPARRVRVIDIHFALRGPIVAQIAAVFAEDWAFAAREVLDLPPSVAPEAGPGASCRAITDGPNDDIDQLDVVIHAALSAARHEILIMTPYFLPTAELVAALQGAALRGVHTAVLLPQNNNLKYVDWATRHQLSPMLERGVRIRYSPGPFCHSKLLIIDGIYVQFGSANWDPRSLFLNFELNVESFDGEFAERMTRHFNARWAEAEEMTPAAAKARSLPVRLRDAFFALFSPYL